MCGSSVYFCLFFVLLMYFEPFVSTLVRHKTREMDEKLNLNICNDHSLFLIMMGI